MRVPTFLKRLWLGLKCHNGHSWFEYADYTMHYNTLNTPVRHRTCQVCGKSETALPLSSVADNGTIDGIWVPRDRVLNGLSQDAFYSQYYFDY